MSRMRNYWKILEMGMIIHLISRNTVIIENDEKEDRNENDSKVIYSLIT